MKRVGNALARDGRRLRARGFTLLEAILALAVFSIAAVALTQALGQMALATVESGDHAWRLELIESYLEEAAKAPLIKEGEIQVDPGVPGLIVKIVTKPLEVQTKKQAAPLPDLFEISVALYRATAGSGGPVLLERGTTYRYRHLYAS